MSEIVIHPSGADKECAYRDHEVAEGRWAPKAFIPYLRGTAAHGARRWALTRFMEDGELPPLNDVFDAATAEAEIRNSEDEQKGQGLSPEEVRSAIDQARPIVATDYELAMPMIAPHVTHIEETLKISLGEGVFIEGTPDLIGVDPLTGTATLPDLKTTENSPGAAAIINAALSVQLSLYSAMHLGTYGSIPLHALDYIWSMVKGPKAKTKDRDGIQTCEIPHGVDEKGSPKTVVGCRRVIPVQRTRDDIDTALLRVRFIVDAERNNFYPHAQSKFLSPCARCAHWGHPDPNERCPWVPQTNPKREAE